MLRNLLFFQRVHVDLFACKDTCLPNYAFTIISCRHASAAPRTRVYRKNYNFNQTRATSSVITVPLRLQKRLEKKVSREDENLSRRKSQIEISRSGSSKVVISARRPEFNHYVGQSYSSKEEFPLASNGWAHAKSASVADFFKIHSHGYNIALPDAEDETTFSNLGVNSNLVEVLEQNDIRKPTLIQAFSIPKLLKGVDCIISAETGCGKTLAYLVPIFQGILNIKKSRNFTQKLNEPLAMILVPTRELANQVFRVAEAFGRSLGISVKLLQGGNLAVKIKSPSSDTIDLIVSTVNVISELTKFEVYSTRKINTVVLDEADTLMDDSFSEKVVKFLLHLPFVELGGRKVQIALVCATMPRNLNYLLQDLCPEDHLVKIATPGLHRVMKHVPQTFLRLKKLQKSEKVVELLKEDVAKDISVIIFCNKHDTCNWLVDHLQQSGIECIGLTGGMTPSVRKGRLESYLASEVKVLVCTDVGSRGIDTKETGHVINYDFPSYLADYVHRCGRTGRVGSSVQGKVTNFIAWATEAALVQQIEEAVRRETSLQRIDANIKKQLVSKYGYGMNKPILP